MRIPAGSLRRLRVLTLGVSLGLSLTALASQAWAREGTLSLKDGRTIVGEVISDDDKGVTLRIAGVPAAFPRADINSLTLNQTIQEQYTDRRAKIADDDLERRYGLTYWLYEHKAYDLAQRELADMLKRFPNDESVRRLQNSVEQKIKLLDEQAKAPKPAPGQPAPAAGGTKPVPRPKPGAAVASSKVPVLNDEQVNVIRVYEIEPDNRPRIEVPADVIDMLFREYGSSDAVPRGTQERVNFRRAPGYEQLRVIFNAKARDLYPMVRVLDDPQPLVDYRQIQTRYVLNYCGAVQCHGGENAKKFVLARDDRSADRLLYTNYYILLNWQDETGYMLDLDQPDKSYLLQYGLAPDQAATPHRAVRGYEPFFRNTEHAVYQGTRKWIAGLVRPRQKYPIDYELPTGLKAPEKPAAAATPGTAGTPGNAGTAGIPAPAPRPAGVPATAPASTSPSLPPAALPPAALPPARPVAPTTAPSR